MKKRMKGINWKVLIVSLIIVYLVAFVGSLFTSPVTDSEWYDSIKPSITPPGWVFPIVWNILFFLIALSLYFSWINSDGKETRKKIILVFGINFILNIFWSVLYFGLKNPFYAFIEIFLLWISIVSMIYVSYKIDKKAGWLLVPYLLWVSFAIVLNYLSIQ
jgi:tryptophan-rich sensory protein